MKAVLSKPGYFRAPHPSNNPGHDRDTLPRRAAHDRPCRYGCKERFDGRIAASLVLLGFTLCSSIAFAATPKCGPPANGLHQPAGAYLWQDCVSGVWRFRVTGDGSASTYTGTVSSDANFTKVTPIKLEGGDAVSGNTNSSTITYQLSPGSDADGYDFKMASNAASCLTVNSPTNSKVRVGSTSIAVAGSFNLANLGACDLNQNAPSVPSGQALPTADITPKTVIIGEEAGSADFSVKLSAASSKPVTIDYKTRKASASNAATPREDFALFSDRVVIPAGSTVATISAPVIDDSVTETKERFQVYLSGAQNAELGVKVGIVDILDNDSGGTSEPSNPPPDNSNDSTVTPGPYVYMDDVDKGINPTMPRGMIDPLKGMGWPRIGLADSPTEQTVEQLTKYHMIAAQNVTKVGQAQALRPDILYLRHVNPVEYQLTVKQAMPFNGTGPSTVGSNVYAGHFVYKPGTRLTQNISSGATTIAVENASKIEAGSYAVIYDSPAGSFKNAEHVRVNSVNNSANTITIKTRGYKSQAVSHAKSSIIAQHATGGGLKANAENWVYNQSTACPLDAKGNTFGEAMVNWLSTHYDTLNDGTVVDVRVDGFHFDTDRHYLLTGEHTDVDNDLALDNGVSPSGYNMWGEGMDRFYADLRAALPEMIIVGGGTGTRGFNDLNGVQWEGFPVENSAFSTSPTYGDVDAQLANYGLHVRTHSVGPALTQALSKSPTKLYPYLEPAHRIDPSQPLPKSNAPFRFSFGMSLLDDGFFGQPSSGEHDDVWWDEYSVDVVPGSPTFGRAMATNANNESKVRAHREWMGMPLAERVRIYDPAVFAANKSMITNGGFNANLVGWTATNLSISTDSTAGNRVEGTKAMRVSKHQSYAAKPTNAQVLGPNVNLQKGVEYTLAFAVKSSEPRQMNVAVGGSTTQTFLVPTQWVRRVMSFKATTTGTHRIKFQLGKDNAAVWLDAVYLFKGNASIFQRDFENARVVVNATSTAKTVDLGGTFLRIKGTGQDPINNGAQVNKVTINPYDAAILIRP